MPGIYQIPSDKNARCHEDLIEFFSNDLTPLFKELRNTVENIAGKRIFKLEAKLH
jgi:hypothetical protein